MHINSLSEHPIVHQTCDECQDQPESNDRLIPDILQMVTDNLHAGEFMKMRSTETLNSSRLRSILYIKRLSNPEFNLQDAHALDSELTTIQTLLTRYQSDALTALEKKCVREDAFGDEFFAIKPTLSQFRIWLKIICQLPSTEQTKHLPVFNMLAGHLLLTHREEVFDAYLDALDSGAISSTHNRLQVLHDLTIKVSGEHVWNPANKNKDISSEKTRKLLDNILGMQKKIFLKLPPIEQIHLFENSLLNLLFYFDRIPDDQIIILDFLDLIQPEYWHLATECLFSVFGSSSGFTKKNTLEKITQTFPRLQPEDQQNLLENQKDRIRKQGTPHHGHRGLRPTSCAQACESFLATILKKCPQNLAALTALLFHWDGGSEPETIWKAFKNALLDPSQRNEQLRRLKNELEQIADGFEPELLDELNAQIRDMLENP